MKLFILFLLASVLSQPVLAQNFAETAGLSPFWKYKTFETEHFKVTYQEGLDQFAKTAAKHLEHAHTVLSPILKWQPRVKTHVLCVDGTDAANGFAAPPLRIGIVLYAVPPETWFSTSYTEDWIKLLTFHEYVHILNIDPTSGVWEALRIVFGDIVRPNGLWPSWMLEGLAVYYETRTSILGRGRSPYYEGILRAMVAEKVLGQRPGVTMDQMNGEIPFFPGGEIDYLFGYHLWNKVGNDQVAGEYSIRSAKRFPYLVNSNLNNLSGKTWNRLWDEWIQESNAKYGAEIAELESQGLSKTNFLTNADYSATGGAISPDGNWLAYTEVTKEKRSSLVVLDLKTLKKKHLLDKLMGVGLSFSKDSNTLFFSELDLHDLVISSSDLFSYDFKNNSYKRLTTDLRAKDPTFSAEQNKLAFVYVKNSTNILALADVYWDDGEPELKNIRDLFLPETFTILANPKFSKDGKKIVYSIQKIGQAKSEIAELDIETRASKSLVSDSSINKFPDFDPQGNLIYVSDRSGIDEVYKNTGNETLQLSRTAGGTWMPFFDPAGNIYGSVMTSQGFEIAKLEPLSKPAPQKERFHPRAPESLANALQSPEISLPEAEDYSPWSSLAPRQWSPIFFLGAQNSNLLFGGEIIGFDSSGKHQYDIGAGYQFQPKTVDYTVSYTNFSFGPLWNLQYSEYSDHVNSFDFVRNQELSTSLLLPLQYTFHSWTPTVSALLRDKDIRDTASGAEIPVGFYEYSKGWIPGLSAGLTFNNLEYSKQGFVPEDGWLIRTATEALFNSAVHRPMHKLLVDAQTYIELFEHSSLNPRVAYVTASHPADTLSSYTKLEGRDSTDASDFGKSVGLNSIRMRGYSDRLFITKSALKISTDYYFPIAWLFRGGKTAPVFMKQITGSVFIEDTIVPRAKPVHFASLGFGSGMDTLFFFRVPVRVGLEFHQGLNKAKGGASEVFLSFTTGSLF